MVDKNMKIDIIELQVNNWKSMVEWYEKSLGFTVRFLEDDHQFALLSGEVGAMLGLYGVEEKTYTSFIPYMRVEDVEVGVQKLKSMEVNVGAIEERHWGKRAKITDPEGNVFYLYEEKRGD